MAPCKSILFVDAYDSFSQNITALLSQLLGAKVFLVHIDTKIEQEFGKSLEHFVAYFDAVVLGPGPGNPNVPKDVGILYDVFDAATIHRIPILGICLGFQALCVKYGLEIKPMKEPCHGQPKKILEFVIDTTLDDDHDIFEGIETEDIWATCYNSLGLVLPTSIYSLVASRPSSSGTNLSFSTRCSQPSCCSSDILRILAIDHEENVMAIRHRHLPFWGVQFHPESCKSNQGCFKLMLNWWSAVQKHHSRPITPPLELEAVQNIHWKNEDLSAAAAHSLPDILEGGVENSPTVTTMTSQLMQAALTTGNIVHWKKINTEYSRAQISDLTHHISGTGNVAMLESTRKGRFSIYAILNEPSNLNQGDLMSNSLTWQAQYRQEQFSILDANSRIVFSTRAKRDEVWKSLQLLLRNKRATGGPSEVSFWGGFIGCTSYEHGLDQLEISLHQYADRSLPEISMVWVERSIVYDNQTKSIYIQSIRQGDSLFLDHMEQLLSNPMEFVPWLEAQSLQHQAALKQILEMAEIDMPDHDQYDSCFHQCQAELRAGNSYELCLTTEATISIPKQPSATSYDFELYKNLHAHNPVPFGAFLKLASITVLGTSPEQYLSWSRSGTIDMIPMKGTVKRSPEMTYERAAVILASAKESAENLMIADLIRHDLYNTVGHTSKVEVVKLCEVIEHETVYQLVSHIRAHAPISDDLSDDEKLQAAISYGMEALRQTVPPGSMTGAPKKRSCEILSGLEQRNRGVYSGVLGYMDVGGSGNWSVNIRTAFRCDDETESEKSKGRDVWHLGAGGAITVLSDAEGEWQEMMVKLNSVLQGFKTVKNETST